MRHNVLGIGYPSNQRDAVRSEWMEHDVDFHFVSTTEEALPLLWRDDFVCVTICSGFIDNEQLDVLRKVKPVPIVVLTPNCSVSKRAEFFQRGAADFILHANKKLNAEDCSRDYVYNYLNSPNKATEPLTIITEKDLYFCLEYRTVEIRGKTIRLTAREFDILALLITHPKRVFTFEMIMDLIWNEEYIYYSHKTLINHMSNLRKKLQVAPDVPNYIVNIHGVGYKFDVG